MKVGTENKKRTIVAVALLGIAALLLYRGLRTPAARAGVIATKARVATPSLPTTLKPRPGSDEQHYIAFLLKPTLDPHLRLDLLADSEGVKYEGSGRDIFAEDLEDIPKPSAPGLLTENVWVPPAPPPPPPPPPIKLKCWGWVSQPGESKAIFLAQGENGFIAHEGDIVARRYKVLKIGPGSVEIEDVLSSNRQSIPVAF